MTFECQGSRISGKPLFSIINDLHEAIEAAATKVLLITFPLEQNDEWSLNRRYVAGVNYPVRPAHRVTFLREATRRTRQLSPTTYVQLEALQTLSDNLYRLACPLWLAESAYLSSSGLWTYTMGVHRAHY